MRGLTTVFILVFGLFWLVTPLSSQAQDRYGDPTCGFQRGGGRSLEKPAAFGRQIDPLKPEVYALMIYVSFPGADDRLPTKYLEDPKLIEEYFEKVSYGKHKVHVRTVLQPAPNEHRCYVADSTSAFYKAIPIEANRLGRLYGEVFKKVYEDDQKAFEGVDVVFMNLAEGITDAGAISTLGIFDKTYFSGVGTTQVFIAEGSLASVIIHEYGHLLGLPHPPEDREYGGYAMMWHGYMVPYAVEHLVQLGWIDSSRIVEVEGNLLNACIGDLRKDGKLYRVPISQDEYFWISNHEGTDFGKNYKGKGLLIWHIKGRKIWDVESAAGVFGENGSADPIDGRDRIDRGGRCAQEDFFDGIKRTSFSTNTNPNTNRYGEFTPGMFVRPSQMLYTGISIENIRQDGEDILADFVRYPIFAHDVMAHFIAWPAQDTVSTSTSFIPKVNVRNVGKDVEKGCEVVLEITREEQSIFDASQSIPGLAPMDTVYVTFPIWKGEKEGTYDFVFRVQLLGDENPGNDALSQRVVVRQEEEKLFTDVTAKAGLEEAASGYSGVFGDYDNDGDLDLYVVCSVSSNVLYVNNGDGTFTDGTDAAGLRENGFGREAVFGDVDNDGDLDLYVVNDNQPNVLYVNNGDGTFTDVTVLAGVGDSGAGRDAVLGDYDGDGYLDIYMVNHGQPNVLYRNNGDGTFTDVTVSAGVGDRGYGTSVVWFDYDLDNDLDLYVTNGLISPGGGQPNVLYRNNGDGTYTDVAVLAGAAYRYEGSRDWKMSFAAVVGDYDNDGDLDLYVVRGPTWHTSNCMLLNNKGEGHFIYANDLAKLWPDHSSQGGNAVFGDYDNDGDLDLYVAWNSSFAEETFVNRLFENRGDGGFYGMHRWYEIKDGQKVLSSSFVEGGEKIHWSAIVGLGYHGNCRKAIFVDYDGDGDLDAYLRTASGQVLYRNNGPGGHWLEVKPIGTESNRDGIGAKVRVIAGDLVQLREIHSESGLMAHFGLGERTRIDTLAVIWPSGTVDVLTALEVDQRTTIREGSGVVTSVEGERPQSIPRVFSLSQNIPNPFNAQTIISYYLCQDAHTTLKICNVLGQIIRTLIDKDMRRGTYSVRWDAKDDDGQNVASGIYLYRLSAGDFAQYRRMLLLR